jgi:hypothetical protein
MGLNCEIANVTQRYRVFHKKFLVSMHWNFSKGGELCHCLIGDFFGGRGGLFFRLRRKHRQTKFWHILSKEETCGFYSSGFQRIIYFSSYTLLTYRACVYKDLTLPIVSNCWCSGIKKKKRNQIILYVLHNTYTGTFTFLSEAS